MIYFGQVGVDEPSVPITGLAFLCQQFVLLLRQRALNDEPAAIGLEEVR